MVLPAGEPLAILLGNFGEALEGIEEVKCLVGFSLKDDPGRTSFVDANFSQVSRDFTYGLDRTVDLVGLVVPELEINRTLDFADSVKDLGTIRFVVEKNRTVA